MAESVSNIIGKGFDFEQRIQVETLLEIITGTVAAFVGGANWGPIGTPTLVTKDFVGTFGTALTRADGADFSGMSAVYHLKYSPYCWYTRVTDGTERKSRLTLSKAAQVAKIMGSKSVKDMEFVITTDINDKLKISVDTGAGLQTQTITLNPTPGCSALTGVSLDPLVQSVLPEDMAFNLSIGNSYFDIIIDGIEYRYVVKEENVTSLDEPDFLRLIVSGEHDDDVDAFGKAPADYGIVDTDDPADGIFWDDYSPAPAVSTYTKRFAFALKKYVIIPALMSTGMSLVDATTEAGKLITNPSTAIVLNSTAQGSASKILIYSFPKFFAAATSSAPITSVSSNTTITTIINRIVSVLAGSAIAWIDSATGYLALSTAGAGSQYGISIDTIEHNAYSELGLSVSAAAVYGSDIVSDAGKFEAVYSGKDGDTITLINTESVYGKTLEIYFNNNGVGTFTNYSLEVANPLFIGKLIANDAVASKIVTFTAPAGVDVIPELPIGAMQLSGGNSGVSGIIDAKYNTALNEYRNLDLYQIDMIGVPGSVSMSVADKLEEICEYRKDCFAIVDMPEDVAGIPALGGSPLAAIAWHNGEGFGRTKPLASKFLATYFPWLQINDGNGNNWYAPSVRVFGAVAGSDKIAKNKYAAPAGPGRTTITDIEGLAQYLNSDDSSRIGADELGNSINPIVFSKNRGFYIDGQKNTDRTYLAISRLNVLRTALTIKKRMYDIAPDYFHAPLTTNTMEDYTEVITNMMKELQAASAIKEGWTVKCDTSINTKIIEAKRGLIAIIEWEPVRSIEKIKFISVIKDMQVQTVFGF